MLTAFSNNLSISCCQAAAARASELGSASGRKDASVGSFCRHGKPGACHTDGSGRPHFGRFGGIQLDGWPCRTRRCPELESNRNGGRARYAGTGMGQCPFTFERTFSSTEMLYGTHELVYTMSAPETCLSRALCVSNCLQNCCGVVFRIRMQPMRSCREVRSR